MKHISPREFLILYIVGVLEKNKVNDITREIMKIEYDCKNPDDDRMARKRHTLNTNTLHMIWMMAGNQQIPKHIEKARAKLKNGTVNWFDVTQGSGRIPCTVTMTSEGRKSFEEELYKDDDNSFSGLCRDVVRKLYFASSIGAGI